MSIRPLLLPTLLACSPSPMGPGPSDSGGKEGWRDVAAADLFTCALDAQGAPHCWGSTWYGEVPDLQDQVRIEASGNVACSLGLDSELRCWGWQFSEELKGIDVIDWFDSLPLNAGGVFDPCPFEQWEEEFCDGTYIQVPDAARNLVCASTPEGGIRCAPWAGQEFSIDAELRPDAPVVDVACTDEECCYLEETGQLRCGLTDPRDHGYDLADSQLPLRADGAWTFITADRGGVCALDAEGRPTCWPAGSYPASYIVAAPLGPFVSIDIGDYHVCGLSAAGEITCWGNNSDGKCDVPDL